MTRATAAALAAIRLIGTSPLPRVEEWPTVTCIGCGKSEGPWAEVRFGSDPEGICQGCDGKPLPVRKPPRKVRR